MRQSKFGFANKKTAKNYKSYSILPKYFDEDDRIRYINLEIGIDILTAIEKETGRKYIGENVLEEINAMNNTIKEIAAYQKRKEKRIAGIVAKEEYSLRFRNTVAYTCSMAAVERQFIDTACKHRNCNYIKC